MNNTDFKQGDIVTFDITNKAGIGKVTQGVGVVVSLNPFLVKPESPIGMGAVLVNFKKVTA
jgi:hypothetical protein